MIIPQKGMVLLYVYEFNADGNHDLHSIDYIHNVTEDDMVVFTEVTIKSVSELQETPLKRYMDYQNSYETIESDLESFTIARIAGSVNGI